MKVPFRCVSRFWYILGMVVVGRLEAEMVATGMVVDVEVVELICL